MPVEQRAPRSEAKRFWQKPGLFGFNGLALFIDAFGTEALTWAPETIEMELRDEFGGDAEEGNFERLMVAISVLNTDSFFTSVPDFIRGCVTLSGHRIGENAMILPNSGEIAWGITEAMLMNKPDDKDPFVPEIVEFIRQTLDDEGVLTPPDVLRIATNSRELVEKVNYEYSDDPEMFSAIQKNEEDRSSAIDLMVKGRLKSMLMQLRDLPLANSKDKSELVGKLLTKLPLTGDMPLE